MRIMHIYRDFASPGGDSDQMRDLANAQIELGHTVVAVCSSTVREVEGNSIDLKRVKYDFRGFWAVYKIIKSNRPDYVHISALLIPMDSFFGLFAKIIFRIPVIVSPHGSLNPLGIDVRFGGKPKSKLMTLLKRAFIATVGTFLLRTVDAVHAHSEYEAEILKPYGAKRIITVSMGVKKEELEAPGRKNNGFKTFTYFGRCDEYHKSLDLLLGAIQKVKDAGYQFKVRLVCSDVSGSFLLLKKSVESKKLADVVTVEPRTKSFEEILIDTDFYLGVYRYAGMARTCGTAIAKGVPLIASREGCWGDWVSVGRFGIVSALNVQDFSDALIKALELSEIEYESMSERAYEFAKLLNWSFVAREFIKGYKICMELKSDQRKSSHGSLIYYPLRSDNGL